MRDLSPVFRDSLSRGKEDHQCGEHYCGNCNIWDSVINHQCYIRRPEPKNSKESLIVFDFECTQETGTHIPNLAVARRYNLKSEEYDEYIAQKKTSLMTLESGSFAKRTRKLSWRTT